MTFQPRYHGLIHTWDDASEPKTLNWLEEMIQKGRWQEVPPIWVSPNIILNWMKYQTITYKPFILHGGHHRLAKAKEHKLPVRAYLMLTPGNPRMPEEERLTFDID